MKIKPIYALLGAALVATLLAITAWHKASTALDDTRTHVVAGLLEPASSLLMQNQTLIKELQTEPFAEKDAGILVAYLAKIRRDGLPRHAAMKQRLEQLADNQLAVVTLLTAYAPQARTPGLTVAADKYRKDAAVWRERWIATMPLFMAGGSLAETEVPAQAGLLDAVQAERTVAR